MILQSVVAIIAILYAPMVSALTIRYEFMISYTAVQEQLGCILPTDPLDIAFCSAENSAEQEFVDVPGLSGVRGPNGPLRVGTTFRTFIELNLDVRPDGSFLIPDRGLKCGNGLGRCSAVKAADAFNGIYNFDVVTGDIAFFAADGDSGTQLIFNGTVGSYFYQDGNFARTRISFRGDISEIEVSGLPNPEPSVGAIPLPASALLLVTGVVALAAPTLRRRCEGARV